MITLELSNTEMPGEPAEDSALLNALDIAIARLKQQHYLDADYMQQQVLKAHQSVIERLRDRLYRAQFMATPDLSPPLPDVPKVPDLPIGELVRQLRELDETIKNGQNTIGLTKLLSLQTNRCSLQEMLDRQQRKNGRSKAGR